MRTKTVWETFHGKNLDKLVDQAHSYLDHEYQEQDTKVQFLNGEYVVTVRAVKEALYHYEIIREQNLKQLQTAFDDCEARGLYFEIIHVLDDKDVWALLKVYDE